MSTIKKIVDAVIEEIGTDPVFTSSDTEFICLAVESTIEGSGLKVSDQEKQQIIKNVTNKMEQIEHGTDRILSTAVNATLQKPKFLFKTSH